jgi:hypothetical protein
VDTHLNLLKEQKLIYFRTRHKVYFRAVLRIIPDPNPDPYVFGPPGSGSISQRYGSESGPGSFYHHAKMVRKTLIPTIL